MQALLPRREHQTVTALREPVRRLPSTMARLVFLTGLRDPNSGIYSAPIQSREASKADVDRLLRRMHEEAFATWLNYGLEEQKADLDLYFSDLDCSKAVAVQTWLELEPYRLLVPASASREERQLFFGDLEALLKLQANELGTAAASDGQLEQAVPGKPLLTTKELSGWLGVPTRTLRLWAEVGEMPAIKIGRQWRFCREAIRDWLRSRRAGG